MYNYNLNTKYYCKNLLHNRYFLLHTLATPQAKMTDTSTIATATPTTTNIIITVNRLLHFCKKQIKLLLLLLYN